MPETKLPSLGQVPPGTDPQMRQFLERMREALEVRLGRRGDPLDTAVTFRDFDYTGGTVNGLKVPGAGGSGGVPAPIAGVGGIDPSLIDYALPPDPVSFAATGGFATNFVTFTIPEPYKSSGRHAFTEIRGADRAPGDPAPVFSSAVLIGSTDAQIYADAVGATGKTRHYWARFVKITNDPAQPYVYSAWVGGTNGVAATSLRVGGNDLTDYVVSSQKIASGAVGAGALASGAVVQGKIAAGAIIAGDGAIANAAITNALIANAAVDDAKIANLSAGKITAGDVDAARMQANIVTALVGKYSTLSALTASLGTVTINSSGWLVTNGVTGYGSGTSGVFMGYEGGVYKFRVGNPAGNYIGWDGSNLTVIGPQFSLSGGTATFSGALSAATGTFAGNLSAAGGTFSGTLTASAINAVNTINITGEAVVIPRHYYSVGSSGYDISSGSPIVQSGYIDPQGQPVTVIATVTALSPSADFKQFIVQVESPSGLTLVQRGYSGPNPVSLLSVTATTTSTETGVYKVRAGAAFATGVVAAMDCSLLMLATKR